jgi:K+ transporter
MWMIPSSMVHGLLPPPPRPHHGDGDRGDQQRQPAAVQLVPAALAWAKDKDPEMDLDPEEAHYFLSSLRLTAGDVHSLPRWRRRIFLWLCANEPNRTTVFHLPPDRTAVVGGNLEI